MSSTSTSSSSSLATSASAYYKSTMELHPIIKTKEPELLKISRRRERVHVLDTLSLPRDLFSLHTWPAPPTPTRRHQGISIADTLIPKTPTSAKSLQSDSFTNNSNNSTFSSIDYTIFTNSSSSAPTTPITHRKMKTYVTPPQSDGFDINTLDTLYKRCPLNRPECAGCKTNDKEDDYNSYWSDDSDDFNRATLTTKESSLRTRESSWALRKKKSAMDLRKQRDFTLAVPSAIVVTPPPSPYDTSIFSKRTVSDTQNFSLPSSQIYKSSALLSL